MSAVRHHPASSPRQRSPAWLNRWANASGTVNHRRFYCPLRAHRTRLSQSCPVRSLLPIRISTPKFHTSIWFAVRLSAAAHHPQLAPGTSRASWLCCIGRGRPAWRILPVWSGCRSRQSNARFSACRSLLLSHSPRQSEGRGMSARRQLLPARRKYPLRAAAGVVALLVLLLEPKGAEMLLQLHKGPETFPSPCPRARPCGRAEPRCLANQWYGGFPFRQYPWFFRPFPWFSYHTNTNRGHILIALDIVCQTQNISFWLRTHRAC